MPSMREGGSRRFMSNPDGGHNCARAIAAMRGLYPASKKAGRSHQQQHSDSLPSLREGKGGISQAKSLLGSAGLRVVLAFAHKLVTFFAVDSLGIGFL
jgi:hypothetical protein